MRARARRRRATAGAQRSSTAPGCTPTRWRAWRVRSPSRVYPRKGEFLVFSPPPRSSPRADPAAGALRARQGRARLPDARRSDHRRADRARARGQARLVAWSPTRRELILERARRMYPALEQAEPLGAYAGLRPAGRRRQLRDRALAHAIRRWFTWRRSARPGLSASLAIGEHVAGMLSALGVVDLGHERRLAPRGAAIRLGNAGGNAPRAIPPGRFSGATARRERAAAARHRRGHDGGQGGAVRRRAAPRGRGEAARAAQPSRARAGRAGS